LKFISDLRSLHSYHQSLQRFKGNRKDLSIYSFSDFSLLNVFIFLVHNRFFARRLDKKLQRKFEKSSFVSNDDFSSPFMEQCTLDAIGVLIISPTAGGGGLGRLRCNVASLLVNIALKLHSVPLPLTPLQC